MRLLVVDAFTSRPFSGNPTGVCLLPGPADPQWMANVAAEMEHAETAFVHRTGAHDFALRWFTPTVEVDLCGHATLASGPFRRAGYVGGVGRAQPLRRPRRTRRRGGCA